jgi:hypothetical protein
MKRAHCLSHRDIPLIEWLYEDGIGEERAMLVNGGQILEARIARHGGIRAGLIAKAQLTKQLVAGKRGIARLEDGQEVFLSPLPAGITEGQSALIEIKRAAIDEKSRFKLPWAKPSSASETQPAPSLNEQVTDTGIPVRICHPHQGDEFAANGWHDIMEEARSGHVNFAGGSLFIAVTPAMTLIDVDGDMPPLALALAAAQASAHAIRRLDIQGSIGIDFPNVSDKQERQQIVQAFDYAMHGDHERTGVNGFGFMQIIRRRTVPSLLELLQHRSITGHALDLLRRAERHKGAGELHLHAHPAIIAKLQQNEAWAIQLAKNTGRPVQLHSDAKLSVGGYYAC